MKLWQLTLGAAVAAQICASSALACGGSFDGFVRNLKSEAMAMGYDRDTVDGFFAGVSQSQRVLKADRSQSVFSIPFVKFAERLMNEHRKKKAFQYASSMDGIFSQIENRLGVSRGVLIAFWAFETDFGGYQGDHNTRDALVTLAHDCRRPELFLPQVFAAIELYHRGDMDPQTTQGAWAGEIGMVQMLPGDIIENAVDGDGDGQVDLRNSRADALWSGARVLRAAGWRPNEPWIQEVAVPASLDWSLTGAYKKRSIAQWQQLGVMPRTGGWADPSAQAALLLPHGHKGPAFIAYENFDVFFEWNQSFNYVLTAAYFATRIEGAPVLDRRMADEGLNQDQTRILQTLLVERGHDVGGIDGVIGRMTRDAVQAEQKRLGQPADGWPTLALINALR